MEKSEKVRHTISLAPEVLKMGQKQALEHDQSFSGYVSSLIKQDAKKTSMALYDAGEG
jgi:hypothetical protein